MVADHPLVVDHVVESFKLAGGATLRHLRLEKQDGLAWDVCINLQHHSLYVSEDGNWVKINNWCPVELANSTYFATREEAEMALALAQLKGGMP